ncbi:uracil-DNA glycosylase [Aquicoccus porphyridii]|uniref:Type-4 uracil-DNA glycosylase n=1 Tax=Aquicoccus porphyridii TaxID=1852029 RepID=A0A5A9Z4V5_9RHOB|nr:uracil-DNA glycosylase [Aquicoccus porphyridii]KAA0912211.1 uracil-DNA glycosylase [Aquicoccus porphyridii]RAI52938.1 uracil-DNA glycosylase [Rhodobacteraceae bacterium AsT-22]
MESHMGYHAARAALEWQIELGADEAIGDAPVVRYGLPEKVTGPDAAKPEKPASPAPVQATPLPEPERGDPVAVAREAAEAATDLVALRAAMDAYELCDLKRGARQLVFADGQPGARVMIIGEAPGRDEDREGRPFVGAAGQLLDRMLAAIGMARAGEGEAVYITNVMPWRPPQNRDPKPEEIAMMLPFLGRHVELAAPDILVVMGNTSCQAVLGQRGITRLRGTWSEAFGRPALPMFHPAYLLRNPGAKREAWADLLSLRARLETGS